MGAVNIYDKVARKEANFIGQNPNWGLTENISGKQTLSSLLIMSAPLNEGKYSKSIQRVYIHKSLHQLRDRVQSSMFKEKEIVDQLC